MKKILLLTSFLLAFVLLQAQTVIYSDNFDSYTAGQKLCSQNNVDWTTWSNAPGGSEDATITTEQAHSGSNSMKITGENDIIYRFSNQTSGVFDIDFYYYVPSSGSGAYFNVQHYYNPGVEWAFECFIHNNGSGYVTINGTNTNFTYPSNAWFPVKIHVDLDNISATLTINQVDVVTWPFDYTGDGINGINQLGSVNFYAGAPNNASGTYYVDDFVFSELSASNDGALTINPNSDIVVNVFGEYMTGVHTIELGNSGGTPVNYRLVPTYDFTPITGDQNETVLTYAGNLYTGILFGTTSVEAAIGYTAAEQTNLGLIGKTLNRVEVYLENTSLMINPRLRVYQMNGILVDGPGEVAYEQSFNPVEGINSITLTTPYVLDGRDLWFGICFEQTAETASSSTRPSIGCDDAVTPNPNGNWCKTSVAWGHLDNNSALTYNWQIMGYVSGTPISPWMSFSPSIQGSIGAGGSTNINITFEGAEVGTTRTGKLYIYSNVLNDDLTLLNVTVNTNPLGIDENRNVTIHIFPNPTSDLLNISSENISRVEVYNALGQRVLDKNYSENEITIHTSNWAKGTYILKVTSHNETRLEKIIVQ